MRPSRIQTFMDIAHVFAKRATCFRLNVGAIIVKERHIYSHGYNGSPSGHHHCTGNTCPGKMICHETIHAEDNAIRHLANTGCGWNWDMFTTDSPCPGCAELIIKYGGRRVFFATPYRITDSLDTLLAANVEVYRVTPAGYVMEWKTKNVLEGFDV